jgi:hypothetical protein
LFFPRAAYSLLGGWIWIVLLALYFFVLLLIALNLAPRLIVYGVDTPRLKQVVMEALEEQSIASDWMGEIVCVPELGIRAHVETAGRAAVAQLQATGKEQNLNGWFTLERLLVKKMAGMSTSQPRLALFWLSLSFALFGLGAMLLSSDLPRLKQAISMFFGGDGS